MAMLGWILLAISGYLAYRVILLLNLSGLQALGVGGLSALLIYGLLGQTIIDVSSWMIDIGVRLPLGVVLLMIGSLVLGVLIGKLGFPSSNNAFRP